MHFKGIQEEHRVNWRWAELQEGFFYQLKSDIQRNIEKEKLNQIKNHDQRTNPKFFAKNDLVWTIQQKRLYSWRDRKIDSTIFILLYSQNKKWFKTQTYWPASTAHSFISNPISTGSHMLQDSEPYSDVAEVVNKRVTGPKTLTNIGTNKHSNKSLWTSNGSGTKKKSTTQKIVPARYR